MTAPGPPPSPEEPRASSPGSSLAPRAPVRLRLPPWLHTCNPGRRPRPPRAARPAPDAQPGPGAMEAAAGRSSHLGPAPAGRPLRCLFLPCRSRRCCCCCCRRAGFPGPRAPRAPSSQSCAGGGSPGHGLRSRCPQRAAGGMGVQGAPRGRGRGPRSLLLGPACPRRVAAVPAKDKRPGGHRCPRAGGGGSLARAGLGSAVRPLVAVTKSGAALSACGAAG